jgi:hypothetical protein
MTISFGYVGLDLWYRGHCIEELRVISAWPDQLEREQCLVWIFDFFFGFEESCAPRFADALGTLVDRATNSETVIAGSFGAGAGEFLALLARLEELAFERSVFVPQFVFTDDAHTFLRSTLRFSLFNLGLFVALLRVVHAG